MTKRKHHIEFVNLKTNKYRHLLKVLYLILFILVSCKFKYVDENKFIGKWQVYGRNSYDSLQVEIRKESGHLIGKIIYIPDKKILRTYLNVNDPWLTDFQRTSNYQFQIKEARPAADLFSLYSIPGKTTFKVEFINDDKFGLSENGDPKSSTIFYQRIP
jgi:hypothetical protein